MTDLRPHMTKAGFLWWPGLSQSCPRSPRHRPVKKNSNVAFLLWIIWFCGSLINHGWFMTLLRLNRISAHHSENFVFLFWYLLSCTRHRYKWFMVRVYYDWFMTWGTGSWQVKTLIWRFIWRFSCFGSVQKCWFLFSWILCMPKYLLVFNLW